MCNYAEGALGRQVSNRKVFGTISSLIFPKEIINSFGKNRLAKNTSPVTKTNDERKAVRR